MRTNSCICNSLSASPFDTDSFPGNPWVMYMDFIGKITYSTASIVSQIFTMGFLIGYTGRMLAVSKEGRTSVISDVGEVYIPTTIHDFRDFKNTLRLFYAWKVCCSKLFDILSY